MYLLGEEGQFVAGDGGAVAAGDGFGDTDYTLSKSSRQSKYRGG